MFIKHESMRNVEGYLIVCKHDCSRELKQDCC